MYKSHFMLSFLVVMLAAGCLVFYTSGCTSKNNSKPFTIHKGTNISHWLSQSERRGEERRAFFGEQDVKFMADLGFDHLRIPIDEEQMWDEQGNQEAEAFALLDSALDWCARYNLKAIVDLHILRSHHFNYGDKPLWTEPAAQEHFLDFWRQLSAHLQNRPTDMVAYEPMNEPVADDPEQWNVLLEKAIKVIREKEPNRTLVIGSNRWQSVDTFDQLRIPENDRNILLSFHSYTPMIFTHYKASWTKVGEYTGPVQYPGVIIKEEDLKGLPEDLVKEIGYYNGDYNRDVLVKLLEKPLAVAAKYNLPLYCGEWGCLPTVPEAGRMQWYADMRAILEQNNIAWATWDYKGNFGIISMDGQEVYQNLIDVLLK